MISGFTHMAFLQINAAIDSYAALVIKVVENARFNKSHSFKLIWLLKWVFIMHSISLFHHKSIYPKPDLFNYILFYILTCMLAVIVTESSKVVIPSILRAGSVIWLNLIVTRGILLQLRLSVIVGFLKTVTTGFVPIWVVLLILLLLFFCAHILLLHWSQIAVPHFKCWVVFNENERECEFAHNLVDAKILQAYLWVGQLTIVEVSYLLLVLSYSLKYFLLVYFKNQRHLTNAALYRVRVRAGHYLTVFLQVLSKITNDVPIHNFKNSARCTSYIDGMLEDYAGKNDMSVWQNYGGERCCTFYSIVNHIR